jgi:hypothetical protein
MSQKFRIKKWWRIPSSMVVAACFAAALALGAYGVTAPAAGAAPVQALLTTVAPSNVPVTEIKKEVLGETSVDGPAFSSLSDYTPSPNTYPPNTYPASVIAWTGTDGYHSLNVVYSLDGFNFNQKKVILHENSATRPAVLLFQNHTSGTLAPNLVVLAWTGTDPNHSLNVMFDVYGARQMITLADNSAHSPALAYFKGQIWLAWTGTDPQRSLNVMAMGPDGLTPGHKTILTGQSADFSSRSGPALRADTADGLLLLSWSFLSVPAYIDLAQSPDGSTWSTSFSPPPPQVSASSPDVLSLPGKTAGGLPDHYWTWTGTDPLRSLNIAYTSTLASWPAPVVTLDEQAFGAPALGYSNKLGLGATNAVKLLLAWTGMDAGHHLNVAVIQIG